MPATLTLALSQRERVFTPFSLREKGGDDGKSCHHAKGIICQF